LIAQPDAQGLIADMPRIDFAFGVSHRLRTACEVVHKHYLAGRRLVIYSSQPATLSDMDQWLWRFEPTAFVPHLPDDDPLADQTPVLLCATDPQRRLDAEPEDQAPWLVNLDIQCPPAFERFERILEIVSHHTADTQAARARWRRYVAAGFAPKGHDLSAR